MKQLTEREILDNYDRFTSIIEETFSGERLENIKKMMEDFDQRFSMAPASSFEHLHSAYYGGLCEHTLRVYDIAMEMYDMWERYGATMNYDKEEVVMCALFHDLGKAGDLENEYYIPQESDWHRANRGQIFKLNEKCIPMPHQDLALFILQHYNIPLTANEWITIKVHEGMYYEDNKQYFINWDAHKKLRSNLPFLLHHADMTATEIEFEQWKDSQGDISPKELKKQKDEKFNKKKSKETLTDVFNKNGGDDDSGKVNKKLFDEFFENNKS